MKEFYEKIYIPNLFVAVIEANSGSFCCVGFRLWGVLVKGETDHS